MNRKLSAAALFLSAALLSTHAFADCDGTNDDAKRLLAEGKAFESQGKKQPALFKYQAATGYFCEKVNPYAPEAAKRAAPLALELGAAAEKRGEFEISKQLYEAGGHYAAADRAYMQYVRANADNAGSWEAAVAHFNNRQEEWFLSNNAASLEVVKGYKPDPKLIAEVDAMPARALERLTKKEAGAFNEEYLREYVQASQSRPNDPTDAAGMQRSVGIHQAFAQKWKGEDLLKTSRETLSNLRFWGIKSRDPQYAKTVLTRVSQLVEQRASTLRQKYSAAPKLLEDAIDYYHVLGSEDSKARAEIVATRAQALKLGDEANAKQRLGLAAEYYSAADQREKAQAARDRNQQLAMQKMQPQIDAARKQQEEMQKQFGDPAKVEEMRKQAAAAAKAIQEQQDTPAQKAARKEANRKSAEDLEKELGL
jgi:hypothetical protein